MNNDKLIYQYSKTMSNFNIANKPYLTQKRANPNYYGENYPLVKNSPKNFLPSYYRKILKESRNRGILDTGSLGNKNIIFDSDSEQYKSTPQKKKISQKNNATNLYVAKAESSYSNNYTNLYDNFNKSYYIKNENPKKEILLNDSMDIGNYSAIPLGENFPRREENGVPLRKKNIGDDNKSYYLKKNVPNIKKNFPYYKPKKIVNVLNFKKSMDQNPRYSMEEPSPKFLNNSNNFNEDFFNQTYHQKPLIKISDSTDYENSYYNKNNKKPIYYNRVNRYNEMTTDSKGSKKPNLSISRKKSKKNSDLGGIVDLSVGIKNLHNESAEFENDENENAKTIQNFIRDSFKKDICAAKIQALWRGANTRKIVNLYNDIDEFVYHISKVKFDRFRDDFYFFINQLFNKYEENFMKDISKENGGNEENIDNKNDNENNLSLNKNEDSNEKKLENLQKKYDDLYEKYNDLLNSNNLKNKPNRKSNDATTIGLESTNGSIYSNNKFKKANLLNDKNTNDNLTFSNDYDADLDINYMSNQEEDPKNNDNSNLQQNKFSYSSIHNNSNDNSKYFDNEKPKNLKSLKKKSYDRYNRNLNNLRKKNNKSNTSYSSSAEKSRNLSINHRTPEKNISISIISMPKINQNLKQNKNENKICRNKGFTLLSEYCYETDDGYYYETKQKKTKEINKIITKKTKSRNFDQNEIYPTSETFLKIIDPKKSIDQLTMEIFDNEKLIQNIEKKLNDSKPILKPKILKENSFLITKSTKKLIKEIPKLTTEIENNINDLEIIQNNHRNFSPSILDFDNNNLFIGENEKLIKKQKLKKIKPSQNEINFNIQNYKTEPTFFNSNKTIPSENENTFTIYTKKIKPKNLISRIKPITIKKTRKTKSPKKFDETEFEIEKIKKNNISITKPKLKAKPKRIKIDENTKFEIPPSYNKQIIYNNKPYDIIILEPECQASITIYNDYIYILDKNRSPIDAITSPRSFTSNDIDISKNKKQKYGKKNLNSDISKENDIELLGNEKENIFYPSDTLEISVIDKKKKKKSKIKKNDNFIINSTPKKWNNSKDLNPEQYVSNLDIIKSKPENINKSEKINKLFIENNEIEIKGIKKKILTKKENENINEFKQIEPTFNEKFSIEKPENKIYIKSKSMKNIIEKEEESNNEPLQKLEKEPFYIEKNELSIIAKHKKYKTKINDELNILEPSLNEEFSIKKPYKKSQLKSKPKKIILKPENQLNNQFTVEKLEKEKPIIIQNDEFSLGNEKNKHSLPSIIELVQENELTIKGKRKRKLQKESQLNNQFTVIPIEQSKENKTKKTKKIKKIKKHYNEAGTTDDIIEKKSNEEFPIDKTNKNDSKKNILLPDSQNNKFTLKKNKKNVKENETEITDELNVMEPTLNEEFSIVMPYKKHLLKSKPKKTTLQPDQSEKISLEKITPKEKETKTPKKKDNETQYDNVKETKKEYIITNENQLKIKGKKIPKNKKQTMTTPELLLLPEKIKNCEISKIDDINLLPLEKEKPEYEICFEDGLSILQNIYYGKKKKKLANKNEPLEIINQNIFTELEFKKENRIELLSKEKPKKDKEKKLEKNLFVENSNEIYLPSKQKSLLKTSKNENFKISKNKKHLNENETEIDDYFSNVIPNEKIEIAYYPKIKNIIDSNNNNLEIIQNDPELKKSVVTTTKKLIKSQYVKNKFVQVDFDKCNEFEILGNKDKANSSKIYENKKPLYIELQNSINIHGIKKKKMKKKKKSEQKTEEEIKTPNEKIETYTDTTNLNTPNLINKENDFTINKKKINQNELINQNEINLEILNVKKKKKLKKKKDKTLEESTQKITPTLEMENLIQFECTPTKKEENKNEIIPTNTNKNTLLENIFDKNDKKNILEKAFNKWKNPDKKTNENDIYESVEKNNDDNEAKDDEKVKKVINEFRKTLKTRMQTFRIEKLKTLFKIFNDKEIPTKQYLYLLKWANLIGTEPIDNQICEEKEEEIPKNDIRYLLNKYFNLFWKKFMGEFVDEYAKTLTYSSGFELLNNIFRGNYFDKFKENVMSIKPQKKRRIKRNSRMYEKQKVGLEKLKNVLRENIAKYLFMDMKLRKLRILLIRFALKNKN